LFSGGGVQLDNITIAVRPRSNNEAMDLGLRLVQTHGRALYGPWFAIILPLFVLLNVLLSQHLWLAMLIVWWLKPLYDRVLLHVLSRALFGQTPSVRETLNSLPAILKNGLFTQLSIFRLSPRRSFLLPVWQLEGLKGAARRARVRVLKGGSAGRAVWLLIVCIHLEAAVHLSLYGLIYIFLPQDTELSAMAPFFSDAAPYWAELISNSVYMMAILVIEPFYVAAGFMLYIQRRTQLEAWDVEIRFRRLAQRLGTLGASAAALLLAVLLCASPVDPAQAAPRAQLSPAESRSVVTEILAHEDFSTEKRMTTWVPKGWWPDWDFKKSKTDTNISPYAALQKLVAGGLKLILVILVVLVAIYLVLNRKRWLAASEGKKRLANVPPTVLFGMDMQPESLPDNLAETAYGLWTQGRQRESLGLLYRGSLSHLVNHDALALNEGMTEFDIEECARNARLDPARVEYLSRLAWAWKTVAYAHRQPDEGGVRQLFTDWPNHFVPPVAA
jgi:hypothetical protein